LGNSSVGGASTAYENVAVGYTALDGVTTGADNVAVGTAAGSQLVGASKLTTGNYNVIIGAYAEVDSGSATNRIAIGTGAIATADNQMVLGGDGTTGAAFLKPVLTQVIPGKDNAAMLGSAAKRWSLVFAANGTINTSDACVKTNLQSIPSGLETLLKLQPKTYFKHKSHFENGTVVLENDGNEEAGFLAQDVSGVIPTAAVKPADESTTLWGMRYDQIIPYTVKAVQELKAENDALKTENAALKADVAAIKKALGL
jgi:hypothetical protein